MIDIERFLVPSNRHISLARDYDTGYTNEFVNKDDGTNGSALSPGERTSSARTAKSQTDARTRISDAARSWGASPLP